MNKFWKGFLIRTSVAVATVGISSGVTAGVMTYQKNQAVERAEQRGYQNAQTNDMFYKEQLNIYKNLVDEQNQTINDFVLRVGDLNSKNEQLETQIATTTSQLTTAQTIITVLETENADNATKIGNLETQKATLETQVAELLKTNTENSNQIVQLNKQIANLQTQITTLQTTIALNTNTINSLNAQIGAYQTQITNLQNQVKLNQQSVKEYTDKIAQLEKTIAYLESYLQLNIEENQSIVKFMFNGGLYNAQVVTNGNFATVTDPTSTEYLIFNYWMLNDEQVDISTTTITANTTFVANITKKYDAKFVVDSSEYNNQIITENETPTKPTQDPTKEGYVFLGWSLDNVTVIDPATVPITQDTIFTALFAKVYTITFDDGANPFTQQIKKGEYLELVDDPIKIDNIFLGWTLDGENVVDYTSIEITEDTTFIAKFVQRYSIVETSFKNNVYIEPIYVWSDGNNTYYSDGNNNSFYVLDKETKKWNTKAWNVFFSGLNVWSDGNNTYLSKGSEHYILDKENNIWTSKTWVGLTNFNGQYVWSDGVSVYYSRGTEHYVLDKENSTWVSKSWVGLTNFNGQYVWLNGSNTYYLEDTYLYVLNKENSTWSPIGTYPMFTGNYIWTDGIDTYYSDGNQDYMFNKKTCNFEFITWNSSIDGLYGSYVWSDGTTNYFSDGTNNYIIYT